MTPATAPDEGMLVLIPAGGCAFDGLLDLGPGLEASALQRQGAHDLPPGLDLNAQLPFRVLAYPRLGLVLGRGRGGNEGRIERS